MKLQKVFAYKYGDKDHHKYLVTIPEDTVNRLGWEAGGQLQDSVEEKRLVLTYLGKVKEEAKEKTEPKMTYEEFKEIIQRELKKNPSGLTWTELKAKLNLPQKVPNNKWVNQMERDIGLLRIKDKRGIIWRLK